MRRLLLLAATAVLAFSTGFGQASAASNSPNQNAGEESQAVADAQNWFTEQRLAPNGVVNDNAFAAVGPAANSLPTVGGAWTERTPGTGPGVDFSDSPDYIDPTSNFSNSGAGDRWVGGRMTALAAAPGNVLFAGAADGGVWRSNDGGTTWTPVFDNQGTLSIGALLVVPGGGGGYTLYAGTGEANTSSDSYAGIGVEASTDGGTTWSLVGGDKLNGALIFRLAQDGSKVLAATSHGLYSLSGGTWTTLLQPAGMPGPTQNPNLFVGNMITDVAVQPGSGGNNVLAVAGWRSGASTNGLYWSTDGGASFTYIAAPNGWAPPKAEGRTTLAYSSAGDRLYAIIQSPYLLNVGTNGKTLLQGVYESASGSAFGPWEKIATSEKLQASGSAQAKSRIGKGYGPGIQAWYNQFLAVDPANKDHLYLGLEEVYETQDAGSNWNTIAPYWNFGFSCFSYSPFEGTCDHNQAHSDQHAAIIANGTLYIGNDGGVYSRALTNHLVGHWTNDNQHLNALQYYSAAGSGDNVLYGGLQDNGSNKIFPATGTVRDDTGKPVTLSSVQVFGGDGGYTLVDPLHSNNVMTEYTGLTVLNSTNGGAEWHFAVPPDPDPRFIAPIAMDRTNPSHLVAGGAIVWNSDAGVGGTTTWTNIFDTRTALGGTTFSQVTALDAITIGGTEYVAAAWCGPCNGSFSTGGGFKAGIVMLNNSGGTWHPTAQICTYPSLAGTCPASGLQDRYISGVRIDPADPTHAYVSLSGWSRKWMIGPGDDPGVGHVFETTNGGTTWTDHSGNLPDVPMDDIVFIGGATPKLVVATDFGTFISSNDGAAWANFGSDLPNVVVDQLTQDPHGNLVAATHGRGVWTITAP